jgi:nucleoside-diphosphate-sugar epimerase
MHALVAAGCNDGAVNLGTEKTVSMLDLVARIALAAARDPKIETDPSKPEGRFTKSAEMARFEGLVPDFKLDVSLNDGLARMVDWYHATDFAAPTGLND